MYIIYYIHQLLPVYKHLEGNKNYLPHYHIHCAGAEIPGNPPGFFPCGSRPDGHLNVSSYRIA